jgi:hypothetical protein
MKTDLTKLNAVALLRHILKQPSTIGLIFALTAVGATVYSFNWPFGTKLHTDEDRSEFYIRILDADKNGPLAGASIRGCGSTNVMTDAFGVGKLKLGQKNYPCDLEVVTTGYGAARLRLQAQRSDPNMTVVLSPLSPPEPYVEIVRSGPRPSGLGAEYSPWYELRSPPPKEGFIIDMERTHYSLSGDRRCNEWSECQLRQESPESVLFLFRMQGHSEWFPPHQAASEGVLRVQYKPSDQSGTVWVDTDLGVYHRLGSKYYGKTKDGRFMLESDAIKAGYHPGDQ